MRTRERWVRLASALARVGGGRQIRWLSKKISNFSSFESGCSIAPASASICFSESWCMRELCKFTSFNCVTRSARLVGLSCDRSTSCSLYKLEIDVRTSWLLPMVIDSIEDPRIALRCRGWRRHPWTLTCFSLASLGKAKMSDMWARFLELSTSGNDDQRPGLVPTWKRKA